MVDRIYGPRLSTGVRGTECTLMTDKNSTNICKLIYGRAFVRNRKTAVTAVVLMWSERTGFVIRKMRTNSYLVDIRFTCEYYCQH